MRTLLLATTALLSTAAVAAADVAITGSAEMGISSRSATLGGGPNPAGDVDLQFHTGIDVTFTLSGETDGGLMFGATIDLDDATDSAMAGNGLGDNSGVNPDYTVFISGDYGTLTMGDTDGALDWAMTEASSRLNPGSLADDETSHFGHRGSYLDGSTNGQILRYDYSFENFGFAASVELDDTGATDPAFAIGARYVRTVGTTTFDFGVGYQAAPELSITSFAYQGSALSYTYAGFGLVDAVEYGVSGGATFALAGSGPIDSVSVGIQASWLESAPTLEQNHYGVGLGVAMGDLTVHANYGMYDIDFNGADSVDATGLGLSAGYNLGGGASVLAGYNYSDFELIGSPGLSGDVTSYSLGLSFTF